MTLILQYFLSSYLTLSIRLPFENDLESITVTDSNCFAPVNFDLIPETKNILLITVFLPGKRPIKPFPRDFYSISK